jgi:hypothetical protein
VHKILCRFPQFNSQFSEQEGGRFSTSIFPQVHNSLCAAAIDLVASLAKGANIPVDVGFEFDFHPLLR